MTSSLNSGFPENEEVSHYHLNLAVVSIPSQPWEKPRDLETSLLHGTVFECLDMPFFIGGTSYGK